MNCEVKKSKRMVRRVGMKSKNGRMKRIEIERKILLCRPWQRRSRQGSLVEQSLQADSAIVTVMCCSLRSLNAQTAPITRYRLSICSTYALRASGYTRNDARAIHGAGLCLVRPIREMEYENRDMFLIA